MTDIPAELPPNGSVLTQPVPVAPLELSYISLAGENVPPPTRENANLLQYAADFQTSVRNLRVSGIVDIVWGSLVIWLAMVLFRGKGWFDAIGPEILGLALLGVGVWLIANPTPIGCIVDGVLLLLIGLYNARAVSVGINLRAGTAEMHGVVISGMQIAWGIARIFRYRKFAAAAAMQPSAATLNWLAGLVRAAMKGNPKKDESVVAFKLKSMLSYEKWKGILLPEIAILVMSTGSIGGKRDIILATVDELDVRRVRKPWMGKTWTAEVQIRQRKMRIRVGEESLARVQEWRDNAAPAAVGQSA